MSGNDTPAWLTEDTVDAAVKISKNPVAQKVAGQVAQNPKVQAAVVKAATDHVTSQVQGGGGPDPFAPSWATESPSGGNDVETGKAGNTSANTDDLEIDEATRAKMYNWHLLLRLSYMAAAIIMSAAAVVSLMNQTDTGLAFFAVYVFAFSILICCFETSLPMISRFISINFGFLYTLTGRLVFLLFVGFMVFSLSVFGKCAMGILYAVGLLHAIIICKFPKFESYLRRKHFEEGR